MVYSVSAGLDYPGIDRARMVARFWTRGYVPVTDEGGRSVWHLARTEGIICAIESAHAGCACEKACTDLVRISRSSFVHSSARHATLQRLQDTAEKIFPE